MWVSGIGHLLGGSGSDSDEAAAERLAGAASSEGSTGAGELLSHRVVNRRFWLTAGRGLSLGAWCPHDRTDTPE